MRFAIPLNPNFLCYIQPYLLTAQCGLEIIEPFDAVIPGMRESRIPDVRRISQNAVKILEVVFGKHPRPTESVGKEVFVAVCGESHRNCGTAADGF